MHDPRPSVAAARRRHLAGIVIGLATAGGTFLTLERPIDALGSPLIAIALAGVASATVLYREDVSKRPVVPADEAQHALTLHRNGAEGEARPAGSLLSAG